MSGWSAESLVLLHHGRIDEMSESEQDRSSGPAPEWLYLSRSGASEEELVVGPWQGPVAADRGALRRVRDAVPGLTWDRVAITGRDVVARGTLPTAHQLDALRAALMQELDLTTLEVDPIRLSGQDHGPDAIAEAMNRPSGFVVRASLRP